MLRDSLHDHLTDIPWLDIFKLDALVGATEYCEKSQIEIDVDTPHPKSQVKPNSSPWFSAACPRKAIACRNPFFSLCQQNKSFASKWSSDALVIIATGFLKLPNLLMLINPKTLSLSSNLASQTIGKLQTVFSTKVSLLYLPGPILEK